MKAENGEKAMVFTILIKEEEGMFIAHCLELDIVATSDSDKHALDDIVDLVRIQVEYAFDNDNLQHLYHPAPRDVWEEFFTCKEAQRYTIKRAEDDSPERFVPPWVVQACKIIPPRYV